MALSRLSNLCNSQTELINWLLSYDNLEPEQSEEWTSCLTTYTVNYGSPELIRRYVNILKNKSESCLTKALKEVTFSAMFLLVSC